VDAYTLRAALGGTLIRLGWREAAGDAASSSPTGGRPAGGSGPRWSAATPRCASWVTCRTPGCVDFIRSALDLLAYEDGDRLVLAAGARRVDDPATGGGGGVGHHFRPLSYRMVSEPGRLVAPLTPSAIRRRAACW
jgi:hypothetical protein